MATKTWIKVSGAWKEVKDIWIKVGGVWVDKVIAWHKVMGTWYQCMVYPLIEVSTNALSIPYQDNAVSAECDITVNPSNMDTTITKIDTGDGTSWANIVPSYGNGDYSFYAEANSQNGAYPRSMKARISDDSSEAASVDVTVTQQPTPI